MKKKPALKVSIIRYSRLKNLGNYENERLEIEVPAGKDPQATLKAAKQWVTKRLNAVDADTYASPRRGHGPVCICDECM